jgi:hypothetical protein
VILGDFDVPADAGIAGGHQRRLVVGEEDIAAARVTVDGFERVEVASVEQRRVASGALVGRRQRVAAISEVGVDQGVDGRRLQPGHIPERVADRGRTGFTGRPGSGLQRCSLAFPVGRVLDDLQPEAVQRRSDGFRLVPDDREDRPGRAFSQGPGRATDHRDAVDLDQELIPIPVALTVAGRQQDSMNGAVTDLAVDLGGIDDRERVGHSTTP